MTASAPLDLSPRPGAAPLSAMVRAHALMEARLLLRNGEQLVLALAIPLLVLVGGQESGELLDLGSGRRIDVLTPGVLTLAVLSTSFTSVAIATGFERRYGVLKLLGASPLPRAGLLAGKVGAVLLVETLQLGVLSAVAFGLGWSPSGGLSTLVGAAVLVLLGTAAFGALGLLMAGTLRAEATLAGANLIYLLLLAGGAVVVPLARYPEAAQPLLALLPTGALAEGLRELFGGGGLGAAPVAVLVAWAVAAGLATARTFRWE
ncbi:MAG: Efflux ABC transporter, permease protein [uncultured Nocardioidaceae bacterium]|uniref:Efflux ABC transporter, permease protein n=1 Tax=uncultured Nocardioidaceae bacterium TaxID=253824 RepID=A0A6J4MBR5_9ACTN|nr:MAG: Efflux ABC transporter, permease protein [uncultured Nocardioidaceae bacterium]